MDEVLVERESDGGGVYFTANLLGDLGNAAAATGVDGVTVLHVLLGGSVTGPITCFSHPVHEATVFIRSESGSLTDDVVILPSENKDDYPGVILELSFANGFIGSPMNQVNILADDTIQSVIAKDIHAYIAGTNTDPNDEAFDSFVTRVNRIEALNIGGTTGFFTGEIRAVTIGKIPGQGVAGPLRFEGAMQGRIWLQSIDQGGSPPFEYGIQHPRTTAGLAGTIALRVPNPDADAEDIWGGPIKVLPNGTGQIILDIDDAEGYDYRMLTATDLGGGAAGLVPFFTHFYDCYPAFTDTSNPVVPPGQGFAPDANLPIQVRHFGPVKLPAGGQRAFIVERRPVGGSTWETITSCFTESLDANTTIVNLTPVRRLPGGFEYRVTQAQDGSGNNLLLCGLPDGTSLPDVAVADFTRAFQFSVCDLSLGDAESDGCVNFGDITAVLTNFGLTDCLRMGDADRNGAINYTDVTVVLTNFNAAYCDTACGQSLATESTGDGLSTMDAMHEHATAASAANSVLEALMQMGYSSIQAFTDAIAQMTEEDRNAEVRRLGQLLGGGGD